MLGMFKHIIPVLTWWEMLAAVNFFHRLKQYLDV